MGTILSHRTVLIGLFSALIVMACCGTSSAQTSVPSNPSTTNERSNEMPKDQPQTGPPAAGPKQAVNAPPPVSATVGQSDRYFDPFNRLSYAVQIVSTLLALAALIITVLSVLGYFSLRKALDSCR